jgi:hypothetical protein
MQFPEIRKITVLAVLLLSWSVSAQTKIERETDIHKNVKLEILAVPSDLPGDVAEQFRQFLPVFEEVLKENTTDESNSCALTVRISAGFKEIGSAKVRRPTAVISAFRRSSRQEYLGTFILHSYVSDGLVNKEETAQFLTKQILEPAVCRAEK